MVKRPASSSPSPSVFVQHTTPTMNRNGSPKSSPVKSEGGKSDDGKTESGEWTGEKKAGLIEHLIAVGLAHSKLDDLAVQFGVSKDQIRNMTRTGKNNLRKKVVDLAKSL